MKNQLSLVKHLEISKGDDEMVATSGVKELEKQTVFARLAGKEKRADKHKTFLAKQGKMREERYKKRMPKMGMVSKEGQQDGASDDVLYGVKNKGADVKEIAQADGLLIVRSKPGQDSHSLLARQTMHTRLRFLPMC